MSGRRLRRVAMSIGATALLLAGCGGDDEATDSDNGAAESVDEETDDVSTDPAPDDGEDDSSDNGGGASADLPDSFPKELVPLPPDVSITSTSQIDSGEAVSYTATFTSSERPEDVVDYFASEIGDDWTQIMRTSGDGAEFVVYAKEKDGTGDQISLTLAESNGQTDGAAQVILYK